MLGMAARGVALLLVGALMAMAQCAAICLAEPAGHDIPAHEPPNHHHGHHSHHEDSSAPSPHHHGSDAPCGDHNNHLYAIEKRGVDFAPATSVLYSAVDCTAGLVSSVVFAVLQGNAHSPPGVQCPKASTTVLRI